MRTRKVTSVDIARLTGVSQSTVSRVLSGNERVAPDVRSKVLAVARELGYNPNALARSLTSQRSNIIGIVMADISSPFYPYVLAKFTDKIQQMGRQVLLFNAAPDRDVDDVLPLALQYQVDALIITSTTISSAMADVCADRGTPVILFNRYAPGAKASAVCCDNVEAGRFVANLLLDARHQRLAYIAGKQNTSTNLDREKGFTDRLLERGYGDCLREQAAYTYESGAEAARRLMALPDRPDAIFCANDIMALGALDAIRFECGLRVPEDVSVIGFDDIPAAAWSAYALTTIQQPVDRMIDATLALMIDQLEENERRPVLKLIPGGLVRRTSARLPPG
jgi:DNA-binding LacI/PurR family transcriptional regulator